MAHEIVESAAQMLAPDVLYDLTLAISRFAPHSRERGRRYAASGRVLDLLVEPPLISAIVLGTDEYETTWEWNGHRWISQCTCPVGPHCKHAYALACRILTLRDTPTTPAAPRRKQPQPARPPQPPALQRLRTASGIWERQHILNEMLSRAPGGVLNAYMPPFSEIVQETDPDLMCWRLTKEIRQRVDDGWLPPALEPYRERADLAERFAQRARVVLARELVDWAKQQRRAPERSLRMVLRLEQLTGRAAVVCEARLTTPRLADAPRTLQQLNQLRSELSRTPRMLPPEQAALLEWLVQHQVGSGGIYQAKPAWVSSSTLRSLLDQFGGSPLMTWDSELAPDLAARAGIVPGQSPRLRVDPARLCPVCVPRGGDVAVELLFSWSNGEQRRGDEVLYFRGDDSWGARVQPSLVLADGAFSIVTDEPPIALQERFQEAGGLVLPRAECAEFIGVLAASFPHLRDTLAVHTNFHRVTPAVAIDLRDDDWLQFRVFAHDGPDAWRPGESMGEDGVLFEYTPEQAWMRQRPSPPAQGDQGRSFEGITGPGEINTPPPAGNGGQEAAHVDIQACAPTNPGGEQTRIADADVWLEAPDPRAVEPVVEWLASTQAGPGTKRGPGGSEPRGADRDIGWWLPANRKRMQSFADAWERRPADVAYYGTERVRRLLNGTDRITPKLKIESSGVDWFAVSAEWEAEGLQLTDEDIAKLRKSTERFVKLPSGWVHRDVAALHDETAALLADLGIEAGQGEQRLTLWQLANAKPESLKALEQLGADAGAMQALRRLRQRVRQFAGLPRVPPPAGLHAELRPYQQEGLDFLTYAASLGIGAVLADDMGLGKTVQALAWLEHLRVAEPDGGPSLVVCPASVVHNWAREAEHFTPALRVLLLTSGQERHALRREIAHYDLIVTNYALLRRDIDEWEKVELRAAILDEAQNIKNPDAIVTRAAAALQARYRLALTGTPLENRALDLWSILSFVNPGYLGNRTQFSARFDRLDAPPHCRTLLAAKLRPVLLRRTKKEVAKDLPERIEERLDCEMTKEQRLLYLAELQRSRALIEQLSDMPGGVAKNKISILAALTRLRQICCHPALAGGKAALGSGKFDALFELLEPLLAEGHKVLVFSQFVQCLKLLSTDMRSRKIKHHILTGQTLKREQVVAGFQNDPEPCIFLVSLKAGGTGLNLTAASYVVLFDPWWNPAVEAQAIDRTHRIGQDRTVIAYRMLAQGTIEEKIWELQQRKAALVREVLGENGFARTLTRDDLDFLLAEA